MILHLSLPWPPSVNSYWRRNGHVYFISKAGKDFRAAVDAYVREHKMNEALDQRLKVTILASPPDRRVRDLDNIVKSLFDALNHADVFVDDEQIDFFSVSRELVAKPGGVYVVIETVEVK